MQGFECPLKLRAILSSAPARSLMLSHAAAPLQECRLDADSVSRQFCHLLSTGSLVESLTSDAGSPYLPQHIARARNPMFLSDDTQCPLYTQMYFVVGVIEYEPG